MSQVNPVLIECLATLLKLQLFPTWHLSLTVSRILLSPLSLLVIHCRYRDLKLYVVFTSDCGGRIIGEIQVCEQTLATHCTLQQQWLPVQLESVEKERAGVDKEGRGLTLFNTRKETEILKHCHLAEIEADREWVCKILITFSSRRNVHK